MDYWDEYWLFNTDLTGLEDELFLSAITSAKQCVYESAGAKKCMKVYQALSNIGYSPAVFELSLMLYKGFAYEPKEALSLAWARLGARMGIRKAGRLYRNILERIDDATEKEGSKHYAEILENFMAAGIRLKTVDPVEEISHEA